MVRWKIPGDIISRSDLLLFLMEHQQYIKHMKTASEVRCFYQSLQRVQFSTLNIRVQLFDDERQQELQWNTIKAH